MLIGLISDTHASALEEDVIEHLTDCDEVWHAGDIGHPPLLDFLEANYTLRSVYGNIDGAEIRRGIPLNQSFEIDGLNVLITHIGGYPGRYYSRVLKLIKELNPDLYICGHSHILKVIKDKENNVLHMNPGACGQVGFHKFRTMLKFEVNKGKIENLRAIELGRRGIIKK